ACPGRHEGARSNRGGARTQVRAYATQVTRPAEQVAGTATQVTCSAAQVVGPAEQVTRSTGPAADATGPTAGSAGGVLGQCGQYGRGGRPLGSPRRLAVCVAAGLRILTTPPVPRAFLCEPAPHAREIFQACQRLLRQHQLLRLLLHESSLKGLIIPQPCRHSF